MSWFSLLPLMILRCHVIVPRTSSLHPEPPFCVVELNLSRSTRLPGMSRVRLDACAPFMHPIPRRLFVVGARVLAWHGTKHISFRLHLPFHLHLELKSPPFVMWLHSSHSSPPSALQKLILSCLTNHCMVNLNPNVGILDQQTRSLWSFVGPSFLHFGVNISAFGFVPICQHDSKLEE